jgi:hypothetical protein
MVELAAEAAGGSGGATGATDAQGRDDGGKWRRAQQLLKGLGLMTMTIQQTEFLA